MARLVYSAITSLDGYVEDASGAFDWAAPDEEVHAFVSELERPIGTHLYGRRMYETMVGWETPEALPVRTPATEDFARIWQAAEKVVFSRTLESVASARTRLVREFDATAILKMKGLAARDLSVGGAELAAQALRAGIVDELTLLVCPVLVGGGKRALPAGVPIDLELVAQRGFAGGVVALRYLVAPAPAARACAQL